MTRRPIRPLTMLAEAALIFAASVVLYGIWLVTP